LNCKGFFYFYSNIFLFRCFQVVCFMISSTVVLPKLNLLASSRINISIIPGKFNVRINRILLGLCLTLVC